MSSNRIYRTKCRVFEYFWISPVEVISAQKFKGVIHNKPQSVTNVNYMQEIEFSSGRIVDWLYYDSNGMVGNYTGCAILLREPKEQMEMFMKQYGLKCDL